MSAALFPVLDPAEERKMPEEPVTFTCGDFELEGVLYKPEKRERTGISVVVAHPHPMFGGSMESLLVRRICESINERGVRCLRFNFRGVGASGGFHNGGVAEVEDVLAAVRFMRGKGKKAKVWVAGYSFGAAMAVLAARKDRSIKRIACVALPLRLIDLGPAEVQKGQELLLISGGIDTVAPTSDMTAFVERSEGRASIVVIPGADHLFGGRMQQVGRLVAEFLVGAQKA